MTNKDLLADAAKAHGYIDDETDASDAHGLHCDDDGNFYWIDGNGWTPWTPADDDGQALRLAVKLRMSFHFEYQFDKECVEIQHSFNEDKSQCQCVLQELGSDPMDAVRPAIVQAAASTGASKEATSRDQ